MTPEPERVIEDGVAWVAFAYYEELLAERDALVARVKEAERERDDLARLLDESIEREKAAEARVAALIAELREALLSIEAYAEVGGVLVHETVNGWRLLAAADRPEGTTYETIDREARVAALTEALRAGQNVFDNASHKEWALRVERLLAAADRPDEGGNMDTTMDTTPATNALYTAWVLIANVSGGDWSQQSKEWQDAAARWRDQEFHPALDAAAADRPEGTTPQEGNA